MQVVKQILQICRDFERENITNKGKKFIPETIRHYLKNEFYTGIYRLNSKTYDKYIRQSYRKSYSIMLNSGLMQTDMGAERITTKSSG